MAWLSTEFLFYKGSAPCRAVWMTIRALEIDVEYKVIDLLKAENKRPWFMKLNPQHTVPVISDQGFVIWESRACMAYLVNKYANEDQKVLYPDDPETRGAVDKMMYFDMGTFYQSIKDYFKPKMYEGLQPDSAKENILKQSLDYLDQFLEDGGPYACGDTITIADFALLASLTELDAMDYSYKTYGNVFNWAERLKNKLPFYKECCIEGISMTKSRVKNLREEIEKEEKAVLKAARKNSSNWR